MAWYDLLNILVFIVSFPPTTAFQVKRHLSELATNYDYIIAGGGTSGLTVANRLTAAFPSRSVLVVEYGQFVNTTEVQRPATGVWNPAYSFNIPSQPQPGLDGKTFTATVGQVVGGSSAINAQMFDRGSAADYDAWADVTGQEYAEAGWNWEGLLPYFKKSVTFTPPSVNDTEKYGYTYDVDAAYGGNGSIHASFPPFQWPSLKTMRNAWKEIGTPEQKEAAAGSAFGLFWLPSSQDPKTQTRSYSRTGHYDPVANRSNYHLLVGHKVTEVILDATAGDRKYEARGVKIQPVVGTNVTTVKVASDEEVILAAGSLHTPGILQRSGIGPKDVLQAAKITTKVELPGVGQNFQDHPYTTLMYSFTQHVSGPSDLMTNQTFMREATEQYEKERKGPLTLSGGNSGAFLPLSLLTNNTATLLANLSSEDPGRYLPNGTHSSVLEGYAHQLDSLKDLFSSNEAAAFEYPIVGTNAMMLFLKPLSRGSVNIDARYPLAEPLVDYRTFTHPLDVALYVQGVKVFRRLYATPSAKTYGPVEVVPGQAVQTDEDWAKWSKSNTLPTMFHPVGTASLGPRSRGGVVGADLRVHGISCLRIIDASIMPLIPGTHTSSTVYAVAEKAADLIIRDGGGQ